MTLYEEETGNIFPVASANGKTDQSVLLSRIWVQPPTHIDTPPSPQYVLSDGFSVPDLQVLGYDLPRTQFRPGDTVPLILYSQAKMEPTSDYQIRIEVRDANDRPASELVSSPGGVHFPTSAWRTGENIRSWHNVRLDAGMPNGDYSLVATILSDGSDEEATVTLAEIQVIGYEHILDRPEVSKSLDVTFEDTVQLLGTVGRSELYISPAGMLTTTLIWRPLHPADTSLVRFAQVLDSDGVLIAQEDSVPCSGTCPATGWIEDEYLVDTVKITLPEYLTDETYQISTGWYNPDTQKRLTAVDAHQGKLENNATLLPIIIDASVP